MGRSIREESKQYVEKKTRNISELASVDVDAEVFFKTAKKESGEEFSYEFILVDGEEYRMPASVKKHLKAILEKRPDLKRFSVIRSGTTKDDTVYTVMPLE